MMASKRKHWFPVLLAAGSFAAGALLCGAPTEALKQAIRSGSLQAHAADALTFQVHTGTEGDKWAEVTKCSTSAKGTVEVPAENEGVPVTRIGDEAFKGCSGISQIILPDDIKIGINAFADCTALRKINLPDGLYYLGGFNNCKSLKTIDVPDTVRVVSSYAFADCTSLQSVKLPKGAEEIQFCAFSGCTGLQYVTLPETLKEIDTDAFYLCTNLESVKIPGGVKTVSSKAFFGCEALTSVTFTEGTEIISVNAFENCSSLTDITFPASVRNLANNAFSGCTALESMTFGNRNCTIQNIWDSENAPENVIIRGYAGSTAETFAQENNLEFEALKVYDPYPIARGGTVFCDANGDGKVDMKDAMLVLSYSDDLQLGFDPSWYELTGNPLAPDAP